MTVLHGQHPLGPPSAVQTRDASLFWFYNACMHAVCNTRHTERLFNGLLCCPHRCRPGTLHPLPARALAPQRCCLLLVQPIAARPGCRLLAAKPTDARCPGPGSPSLGRLLLLHEAHDLQELLVSGALEHDAACSTPPAASAMYPAPSSAHGKRKRRGAHPTQCRPAAAGRAQWAPQRMAGPVAWPGSAGSWYCHRRT